MMNYQRKPIIIKLDEYLKNESEAKSNISRNLSECIHKNSEEPAKYEQSKKKNSRNLYMISELDEEMKNDFKWLVNFDLKRIIGDIDEIEDRRLFKEGRDSFTKENCANHNKLSLIDILKECLLEKREATVRYIYKWISKQFPCTKSNECRWKILVRETLLENPLFKKKSKHGKSDLWHLDESCFHDAISFKSYLKQNNAQIICDSNWFKLRPSHQKSTGEVSSKSNTLKDSSMFDDSVLHTDIADDIQTCTVPLSSKNWIEQTDFLGKNLTEVEKFEESEYYEMQVPIHIEYLEENIEPIGVLEFLDENNTLIPLQLI